MQQPQEHTPLLDIISEVPASPPSISPSQPKELLQFNAENLAIFCDPKAKGFEAIDEDLEQDQLSLLDPYFDMTLTRMKLVFDAIDTNKDGRISYDAFRKGLESLGIRCMDEDAFEKLVESIDVDNSTDITLNEFRIVVQKLKIVDLFQPDTIESLIGSNYHRAEFDLVDFSSRKLRRYRFTTPDDLKHFFTSDQPKWATVRWLNMNGIDHLNLKRLAIKYGLHPLAIEDTIEMHERPKFDRYEGHMFVVFPVLSVKSIEDTSPRTIKRSNSSATAPLHRTMAGHHRKMSFTSRDDMDLAEENLALGDMYITIEHAAIFVIENTTVITVKDGGSTQIWEDLNRRLNSPYSKLRHNDASFLLYAVLDVIVDRICKVMDVIVNRLVELEHELETKKHKFDLTKLRTVKNELYAMPRVLKPSREVLKNMIDCNDINQDTTAYIRDVHDHIVQVLDDIEIQWQVCRLLAEDYREAKANQMNYVIYTLTIITTVFLPAQFLTGVYGMNFDNMPELHQKYGYYFFWFLVIGIAMALQLYFRYKHWI